MENGRADSSTRHTDKRPWLFISYRRRFDTPYARQLKDQLTRAGYKVFHDMEDIEPGAAFPNTIRAALESCDGFLLLVSPGWVEVIEELRDPEDFVRREVAAALARGIPFIPILLGDARMPEADRLPEEIRDLAFRQAAKLSDDDWNDDVKRLVKFIRKLVPFPSFLGTWRGRAVVAVAVLALFACAGLALRYELSGGDFEGCVRRYTPDSLGAAATVRLGVNDSPIVRADEYETFLRRGSDHAGIPIMLRLSDSERDLGVVFLTFVQSKESSAETFNVEKIIEPTCADVQQYFNSDYPADDKRVVHNWDKLVVRLGGHDYLLRPQDNNQNHIVATLLPAPPDLQVPWR